MKRHLFLPIAGLALLVAVSARAGGVDDAFRSRGDSSRLVPGPVFTWERNVSLDRISVQEVVFSTSDAPSASGVAVSLGAYHQGITSGDLPQVNPVLVRTIPSLWKARIANAADADTLDVTYEIEGSNGHRDSLSNDDAADSEISVTAQPLAPVVVEYGAGSSLIEGGVVLYLDIANARSAGRYSGTVTVAVHHL